MQRTVLYLGEINDQQQAAWRKTLAVFDEQQQEYANLSLFPDDREIPADAVDSLQVKLSGLELRCPRLFGSCWLACELWQQLGLHEFWDARLAGSREDVSWEKVLQLLEFWRRTATLCSRNKSVRRLSSHFYCESRLRTERTANS